MMSENITYSFISKDVGSKNNSSMRALDVAASIISVQTFLNLRQRTNVYPTKVNAVPT